MNEAMSAAARARGEFDLGCLEGLISGLEDVQGLLRDMELGAADMLAGKLAQLGLQVRSVADVREQYRGILVLHRGLEALHGYVDSITRQAPESPLPLAEPINQARDCLGEPPISRFALFVPSLDRVRLTPDGAGPSRTPAREIPQGVRSGLLAQIRRNHRRELLHWLTGRPVADDGAGGQSALGRIRVLTEELLSVSISDSFRLLWWVAGGYLDAVESGEIAVDSSVKSLLARLDQEIVRMRSESGSGDAAAPADGAEKPDDLLRSMLFELGPLDRSGSERIRDIRDRLGLRDWFRTSPAGDGGLARLRHGLSELKKSFDEGWFDSLQALFSRAGDTGPGSGAGTAAGDLARELDGLASGADALGVETVAGLAREIARALREASGPDRGETSATGDIRIASSILLLRHGVMNPDAVDAAWTRTVSGALGEWQGTGMPEGTGTGRTGCIQGAAEMEHRHARLAAARGIHHALGRIEASCAGFWADPHRSGELEAAAGLLQQVGNLLIVLESDAAARVACQAAALLSGVAGSPDTASRMNPDDFAAVFAALDVAAGQWPQDDQAVGGILSMAAEKLDRARRMLPDQPAGTDAEAADEGQARVGERARGGAAAPAGPGAWLEELSRAVREDDRAAMMAGFRGLAAEPGAVHADGITGLAGLGGELLARVTEQGRALTGEEQDFTGLLLRKIADLASPGNGEGAPVDLAAWRERYSGICPADPDSPAPGRRDGAGPAVHGLDILDQDLREIFTAEFGRHIDTLEQTLDALQGSGPGEAGAEDILDDLEDCVHTLGDNCRNLGFDEVAVFAEGCLAPLRETVDGDDFESARTGFRNRLGLLRSARDEIVARGGYSRELADRLRSGGGTGTGGPPEAGEGHRATGPGPAWTAAETADAAEDAIDADIERIFLDESRGILGRINRSLMRWREQGPEQENMAAIRREFHTLKGTSAAAGRDGVSRLIHRVETLLDNFQAQDLSGRSELLGLLEEIHDGLAAELGLLESGEEAHLSGLTRRISGYPTGGEAETPAEVQYEPQEMSGGVPVTGSRRSWMPDGDTGHGDAATGEAVPGARRVHHSNLAALTHASGEMDLVRMHLHNTLDATRMDLELLRINMVSIRDGLREMETEVTTRFLPGAEQDSGGADDHPEPGRSGHGERLRQGFRELSGRLEQLDRVEQELVRRAADIDAALEHQRNLGDRLQSGLRGARMVTLGEYFPHLRHLVRETARKAGKEVDLGFQGGDIQIDRQVIESMMAPFEHMIRNAVIHGIEEVDGRRRSGKDPRGSISISISLQGSELVVSFSDDGRGLAMDRIMARAGELELVDSNGQVSETDILKIITQPGYSTSEALSLEAGRGVGMDIVYQTVRDLGGSMQMNHVPGQGVGFHFRLPVTLAVTPALMVRVGKWRFAFRSRSVERLVRISRDEMHRDGERWLVDIDGVRVPVALLQRPPDPDADRADPSIVLVVIVRLVDRLAAFEVDEFIDSIDILSRNPGTQLLSIPEISGVTVLPDSSIVLILDPEAFIQRIGAEAAVPATEETDTGAGGLRRVLVVDDSAVVRRVMQRDLEADGLVVDTADDGVSALEMLDKHAYDVVLVDIEMPRMNGYELLGRLRENPYERNPAMIVITSGSGEEYRRRALALGADGCITRPYDLAALNRLMRDAVAARRPAD